MTSTHAVPPAHPATAPAPPEEAVAPLIRGIAVLRGLTDAGGAAGLSDLGRATGLARATLDRVVGTLAHMGYVRLDGSSAVLQPRLMELGNAYLGALRLPDLLGGHADGLADELDESVSLAVADGDGIRFIHQAIRRRTLSLSFRIGDLLPAERTAPGPLLATEWSAENWTQWRERQVVDPDDLGFPAIPPRSHGTVAEDFETRVARARVHGWAMDDQLIETGLVAVSVPVRAPDGRIACVASAVSHTSRHSADSLRDSLLPRLRAAVAAMERELADAPPPEPRSAPSGLAVWTSASKQELGGEFITSLARGLTVITAFGEGRAELTLSEVAQRTGLPRATARRALITLEHLGHVTVHRRVFRLTPRVLALGFPPLCRTTLARIAHPHLTALTQKVRESTSLAVLTGDEIQCAASVAAGRIMDADIVVGSRMPAYATSTGRVLLAGLSAEEYSRRVAHVRMGALTPRTVTRPADLRTILDQVREEGYALVDEELEAGLRSIAVPVRDREGGLIAAVNVTMHSSRRSAAECVRAVLPELRATAGQVEMDLHLAGRFVRVPTL
ncbi:IclR family transcriptional regulator domain-containing protein [Streptomyces prunicolor]|uniref:IclR family transcriptional regulator C-terminal domain-containing protein n=1 Tax=Streptomyces prunicolor TaxID=67348 RepID=A0ABU4F303_9ACTN|nr:IclR family transcriptional regulator C-terminal domain-containing protein [Streptomyces prunicolor]MDV7214341.1 IclR family transcriptional regulator C-terminal domain-containing protein [Streptomyces prunicolor]